MTKSHRPPTARAMLRKWSTDLTSELKRTALATIARLDRIDAVDARKAVLEVERQWLLSKHRVQVMIHDNAQYLSQLYSQYCEASRAGLGPITHDCCNPDPTSGHP